MALIDDEYHKLVYKILEDGYIYEDPNRKGTYRTEIDEYTIRHDLTKEFPAITTKKLAWKSVVGELIWFLKGDTNIKYLLDNNINIWNEDAFRFAVKKGYPHSMNQFINGIRDGIHYDGKLLGELGPIYGDAWRKFGKGHWNKESVDQILLLILNLKKNPLASDHVVTALNPTDKEDMALQPCHYGFQIIARPLSKLEKLRSLKEIGATWFTGQSVDKEIKKWKLPSYGFTLKWNQRSVDTFLGQM